MQKYNFKKRILQQHVHVIISLYIGLHSDAINMCKHVFRLGIFSLPTTISSQGCIFVYLGCISLYSRLTSVLQHKSSKCIDRRSPSSQSTSLFHMRTRRPLFRLYWSVESRCTPQRIAAVVYTRI